MPDNSMNDNVEKPSPRGKPLSGSTDFGVLRQTDGHLRPSDDDDITSDLSNPHTGV